MGIRKVLKSVKDYFNLQATSNDDGDFNFAVKSSGTPAKGIGRSIVNYFDLYSQYRASDKLADDIMKLANTEGVTGGRFDSSSMTTRSGFTYTENDSFSVRLERNGRVLLKCDPAFAEKVKQLPSVSSVQEIKPANPATSKPRHPKP